ncbi:YlzJ-like family protein [Herbivorax sp. ANBcel31]|uniref:YlzJ-like family protein n=1 Tax=Herbivorax sp. ANBcel31 TaxID=3069754 RepID=UPI0027B14D4F|nr:YlzJ-like family protein [Herbivorax sp. ANBcel31]MDQ2085834.1 YlzJ-like family protein [Herbivorax sp. ANBcel31]
MILHSIVPVEVVFGNFDDQKKEGKNIELDYLGEKIVATALSNNRYRVDRIISTSLKAYLNPNLIPGSIIER